MKLLIAIFGLFIAVQHAICCPTEPYCVRGPYGPLYGHKFSDFKLYMTTSCANITRIEIWHTYDSIINGLKVTYGESVSDLRGTEEGEHGNHDINGKFITKVEGYIGLETEGGTHRITGLTFYLNDGTALGPYGGSGAADSEEFTAIGTHDNRSGLSWIEGRAGARLDQLIFSFNCNL